MNRRERQSAVIIIGAIILALLIAFIPKATGALIIEDESGTKYVAFTQEEMAIIGARIKAMQAENAELRAKLAKGGCV